MMPDLPRFYQCGICGAYHREEWDGDCREVGSRYDPDDLDKRYGIDGWEEVAMPGGEEGFIP